MDGDGRQRLLNAAREAFLEKTYAATTVEELAETAGVAKGLLYHHFESKAALLDALVTPYLTDFGALLDRFEDASLRPPDLADILGAYSDLIIRHQDVFRLLNNDATALRERALRTRVAALRGRLTALLSDDRVVATAALGVFANPALRIGNLQTEEMAAHREEFIRAAVSVLRGS